MSGLIWSALGQGVANAGALVGAGMMRDLDEQRRLQAEDRREAAALKRMEEAERIREERATRTAEALQQRIAGESSRVDELAAQRGVARRAQALDADAGRLAESSAQAGAEGDVTLSKEQLAGVLSQNPKVRESYRREGLIEGSIDDRRDPRLVMADDRVQVAREIGAHSAVLDSYSKDRRDVLEEIRRENERLRNDQQHSATLAAIAQRDRATDERRRQFDEKKPIEQQNADAATARANRPPSGGTGGGGRPPSSPVEKLTTQAETLRRAIKDAGPGERRDNLQQQLDEVLNALRLQRGAGGTAPASNQAPQSGLPTPKTEAEFRALPKGARFQAPDGSIRIK